MQSLFRLAKRALQSPALVYLIATLLSRLGGFLLLPLYTRRLTEAEYGDYSLAQTAIALLPVLFTLGLNSAIPRIFFTEKDTNIAVRAVGGVVRVAVSMTAIACSLCLLTVCLLHRPSGLFAPWEASCVIIAVLGSMVGSIPDTYLRTRQLPRQAAAFQLGQFVVSITAGILAVRVLGRGFRGALEALAIGNGLYGLAAMVFIRLKIQGNVHGPTVRAALRFALPLVPHFMAAWLQGAIDRWVLKSYGLNSQLGHYALATQLIAPITMAISAWNDTESARLGATFGKGGVRGMLDVRRKLYLGYLAVPVVLGVCVMVARPLVPMILGRGRFGGAMDLLPLLAGTSIIEAMYFPSSNLLYYAGYTSVIPVVTFSSALINVGLNMLLIPIWQLDGAIAARTIGLLLRSVGIGIAANVLLTRMAKKSLETAAKPT